MQQGDLETSFTFWRYVCFADWRKALEITELRFSTSMFFMNISECVVSKFSPY